MVSLGFGLQVPGRASSLWIPSDARERGGEKGPGSCLQSFTAMTRVSKRNLGHHPEKPLTDGQMDKLWVQDGPYDSVYNGAGSQNWSWEH